MATVKCQNPHCDYFQKPVPDGEFCPFCGEPLGITQPVVENQPAPELEPNPQPFPSFETPDLSPPAPPPPPAPLPVSPPPPQPMYSSATVVEPRPLFERNRAFLSLVHDSGNKFSIYEKTAHKKFYIGRRGGRKNPQPEIDLTDIPYSERISRPHAHIIWDDRANSYMFVDENSTNGSILNGEFLEPFKYYPLQHLDRLELGREQMVIFTVELNER